MIDELNRMRGYFQRGIAIAHEIDKRVESPSTGKLIVLVRELLGQIEIVSAQMTPVEARPAPMPVFAHVAVEEEPLKVGDEALYEVAPGFWRRVKLLSEHTLSAAYSGTGKDERAFSAEWDRGSVEVMESECRRV